MRTPAQFEEWKNECSGLDAIISFQSGQTIGSIISVGIQKDSPQRKTPVHHEEHEDHEGVNG
jgi:hypothetical protein